MTLLRNRGLRHRLEAKWFCNIMGMKHIALETVCFWIIVFNSITNASAESLGVRWHPVNGGFMSMRASASAMHVCVHIYIYAYCSSGAARGLAR